MKHIHDVIREHLLKGSLQDKYITRSPEELSLINSVFKLDMNRLNMGMYRYGNNAEYIRRGCIEEVYRRLDAYMKTHNTEYVIDARNMLLIEFLYPTFNDAKFEPIDDGDIHYKNERRN